MQVHIPLHVMIGNNVAINPLVSFFGIKGHEKSRIGIQYPTLVIDPRRYFKYMSP